MRINLCGTRGSTPAPGRDFVRYGGHTSCLAITADGAGAPELLLDSGTGIREVTRLLAGQPFRGIIALTHLHWDHVQGLPFFAAGDRDDATVRLLLPAPEGGAGAEAALERSMSPPSFPITPRQLRGNWSFGGLEPGEVRIGRLTLLAREIPHKGGRTFGYRVSDGSAAIAYLPDHSPTDLGPGPDGLGVYHDAARTLGHAAAEYAIGLAAAAGARETLLLHHRPDRTDADLDKLAETLRDSPVPTALAADGEVIRR